METDEKIQIWLESKERLDAARKLESELRASLCESLFPTPKEGTNTLKLGKTTVKCVLKVNRNLDKALVSSVIQRLHAIKVDTRAVFEYEPKLLLTGYKNLNNEAKLIADECVTSTPGAKSLEVTFGA